MNWKQLYNLATPEERLTAVIHMLRAIEARQKKIIIVRGRLVREKRGPFLGAHFINDRRRLRPRLKQIIARLAFISILLFVSITTWLFVIYAPPQLAAPALLLHLLGLTAVLSIKPYQLKTHLSRS